GKAWFSAPTSSSEENPAPSAILIAIGNRLKFIAKEYSWN
ncbi:MAG: hypothetical protein ACI92G_001494, partial [Candidatus Pelagisphaera sp.]